MRTLLIYCSFYCAPLEWSNRQGPLVRRAIGSGSRADSKVDRGIEVQEHGRRGRAAEHRQPDVDLQDEVARGLKHDAYVWVGGVGNLCR